MATQDLEDITTTRTFHVFTQCVTSLSGFMCFVLILVFTLSLVSDVSPFRRKILYVNFIFTTHTQFQVQSSFLLDVVVRLCPVIVNSICVPNSCIFHIAKTGLLRCCLHSHIPICAKGACGWQPGKGRGMPSSSPHQRTNARVSACQTGLGNHTATKPSSTVLLGNSSGNPPSRDWTRRHTQRHRSGAWARQRT